MIRSLSKDVQSQLRSGIAIFSLQQCVEELLLNSIDAGATCVAVQVDIEACKVQVLDNGSGMDRDNMERVGIRYCTSKCSSIESLDNLCFYGFRGEAIASMAALATMVEITSRTKTTIKTFVKRFHKGNASDVFEAQTTRPSAGTTVQICNIFHNMPVRRKRMDSVLEVERIRQRVEAISLMHPSVSFTVKKDSGTLLVQLPKARNTYYRFVQIHGLTRAQKLGELNYTFGQFEVTGHVGREGHYNNSLQFLYVNRRLVHKTRLHKLLNCLLRRLSNVQSSTPSVPAVVSSPKQKGSADLYAVYIVDIKCPYSEYDVCMEPAKTLIEFRDWDRVLCGIEEGIKAFLIRENLESECSMSDLQNFGNNESSPGGSVNVDEGKLLFKKKVISKDDEMPEAEPVQSNTECKTDLDSHSVPEKDTNNDAVNALQKMLETDPNAQCTDITDNSPPLCVSSNKITHWENSRIGVINHNVGLDSLRRFTESKLSCAPKRKLTLLNALSHPDGCDDGPKIARVTPHRKLTLCFETGSLDKFRRMFGNEVELELRTTNTLNADVLNRTDSSDSCVLDTSSNLVCSGSVREKDRSSSKDNSVFKKLQCSTDGQKNRISLATKLSRKVEYEDTKNLYIGDNNPGTQALDSRPSSSSALENNGCSSNPSVMAESYITTELYKVDHSDEPTFTAPSGQEIQTGALASTTSATEDSELIKSTISSKPKIPQSQIADRASQRELLDSQTGNEEQTSNESLDQEGAEMRPGSSDWLTHYDDSLGKMVCINQVTGLSKYEDASLKEIQVPCTADLTNMAVSVVSKTGFEYRCYPFQTELVLPFLPKPRAERVISTVETGGPSSLLTLYSEWNNPVFVRPTQVAVDVTSGQAEGLAVKIHNILFPYRFTKDMIHSMKVLHQVDKKFLACLINTALQNPTEPASKGNEGNLLVLVDQHAAHERVRLEGLVTDSYEDDPNTPGKKRLRGSNVSPPLEIKMTEDEIRLLSLYQLSLRDLALGISFPQTEQPCVMVECLPACFVEKENTETRRGRRSVIRSIAEEYLQEHIEALKSTGRVKSTLPLTVHNVLASQACHGAIKFNDELSKKECCSLVTSLSSCQLPFQCAHGRPSILPLADLLHLEDKQDLRKPNLRKLRRMYKAWQLYGKN